MQLQVFKVADLFVSYKRDDRAAVERIIARLTQEGYPVWWDSRLEAGASFGERIAREIDEAKCVIVVWSKASVDSKWVYAEATEADSQGKLVPVTIEPCRTKPPFNILHSFNLTGGQVRAECPRMERPSETDQSVRRAGRKFGAERCRSSKSRQ